MINSDERIGFITTYISAYEEKIKLLNKGGLFNAAKLFELFAVEVGSLYLGYKLKNLNIDTFAFPHVDLVTEDDETYIQVSTANDIPAKIKSTLDGISKSDKEYFKKIKNVKFIVLNNESVDQVNDFTIGNLSFCKNVDLITTKDILQKAETNMEFQVSLYDLLKREVDSISFNLDKLCKAIDISKNIGLKNIDCKINNEYEIDRSELIEVINSDDHKNITIHGVAGSGKSVVCKKIVQDKECVVYARAERFIEESSIDNIWGFDVEQTLKYINGKPMIFFIDSLEFIADNPTKLDLLNILYEYAKQYNSVKIITSCRTSDRNAFLKIESNYSVMPYEVKDLTEQEQILIAQKYPIINKIMGINAYKELLKSPLYINLIVSKIKDIDDINDANQLRDYIWQHVICLDNKDIKETVNKIVFSRARNFTVGEHADNYDNAILKRLLSEDVLVQNQKTVRLKYDVFEDICFEQFFDKKFDLCKGAYDNFFKAIEELGRCAYRRYQIWIENKLLAKENRKKFLYELVFSDRINSLWIKQTQIGLAKSRYSELFFKEYGDEIVSNSKFNEFVAVTNLYAFNVRNDIPVQSFMILQPCGEGRKSLIHLAFDNKLYKNPEFDSNSIIKLCVDYANVFPKEAEVAEKACAIMIYNIENTFAILENKKAYHLVGEHINNLLSTLYKMAKFAKEWIKCFWEKIIEYYKSGIHGKVRIADDIIKHTLRCEHVWLSKVLPYEICQLADLYWTFTPEIEGDNLRFFHQRREDLSYYYGLSEKAEYYQHEFSLKNAMNSNFFYWLFKTNFWVGLNWAIDFVNNAVKNYLNTIDGGLPSYRINFVDEGIIRSYLGTSDMWVCTAQEYSMPLVISDLIYCLKSVAFNILRDADSSAAIKIANDIKRFIYDKSNNIVLLTIVADLGMAFKDKLPGYALDLISDIDIVLNDITRFSLVTNNPLKDVLENQLWKTLCMPSLREKRYNNEYNEQYHLRNYAVDAQLRDDIDLKNKCYKIIDYLYSIVPNDEENAKSYLQIEFMDARKAQVRTVDNNIYALVPTTTGKAAELSKEQEKQELKDASVYKLIIEFSEKVSKNEVDISECLELVKILDKVIQTNKLAVRFEQDFISLIAYSLQKKEIRKQDREYLCNIWISVINRMHSNRSFLFDKGLCLVLFSQVETDIDCEIKNQIKKIILELVLYNGMNGLVLDLVKVAKQYLSINKNLSRAICDTIVKIAEDEMNHQKYNAEYLNLHKELNGGKEFEFVPNRQHRLVGIDEYIKQAGNAVYKSNYENIINDYLYNTKFIDYTKFDINNYDINYICYILNCQNSLDNEFIFNITKSVVCELITIFKETEHAYSRDIVDFASINAVQVFLRNELLASEQQAERVLTVLFDKTDTSKFAREIFDFYRYIFDGLTPLYFDSYNDTAQRSKCEKIVCSLERYINVIEDEKVKQELYKSLILAPTRYSSADWSKAKTSYSYKDKKFLNAMFSKYGGFHLRELLDSIYRLHIDKLLPEILISLRDSFVKMRDQQGGRKSFTNIMKEEKQTIISIITIAFFNFSEDIKLDEELTCAFEDILNILIEEKLEEAAVILDEFMIH